MRARELVTVPEAARRVGRHRMTVVGWMTQGRLFAVGLDVEGNPLVDLAAVRELAAETPARRRRRR